MLCPTKNITGKGEIGVLGYGFCVLQVLVDIKNHDIYEYAIIMSSRCWPHYIEGNNINKQFSGKSVGGMDALCGDLETFPLHVFYMKEEDYCMIPMYTY